MRWEWVSTAAGAYAEPPADGDVEWRPVELPARGSDDDDHWFRAVVAATATANELRLGGLATVCDVFVDGRHVGHSDSMFLEQSLALEPGEHDVCVCARALTPILAERRTPRARWRTRVAADGNLRWIRTTLLGRAPGFAPGPPLVGPWRPVELVDPRTPTPRVRARLDGDDGVVEVECAPEAGPLEVAVGEVAAALAAGGGTIRLERPALWWPHTHGVPALYAVHVRGEHGEAVRRVGFRQLDVPGDLRHEGLELRVNGVRVFARGAVWTPTPPEQVRATLERARDAGLNMIRVVGTMLYEDAVFHDACDELGLLVWQDLMFANMDYPFVDGAFRALAEDEVRHALRAVAGRPSLAVVCGNSEIEQQVAMLGLPPELGREEFFEVTAPALVRAAGIDAAYLPSAPTGGAFPFRTDEGVANYFGVGAYLRPLEDVRRASVRFASECLAFANVPDDDPSDRSAGVMRDVGADWDFADVRDHYLRTLHGVGAEADDYWDYARHVTGELMARVFGEWRRSGSGCGGGIVLWLRDLAPGAGWGILDHDGRPKVAWHALRRALAPIAVWLVDEGLNGVGVHAANDTPDAVGARLRLTLYRDEEVLVAEAVEPLVLGPHGAVARDAEALLGRFVDISYAYRFGAVQQDTVVATLEREERVLSQAFLYPVAGRRAPAPATELGVRAEARRVAADAVEVSLDAARVVRGVRVRAAGFEPEEDAFDLEPNRGRSVVLTGRSAPPTRIAITALNLSAPVAVEVS